MSDERILEIIENKDKYYILGFVKGIKANVEELRQETNQLKADLEMYENGVYFSSENDKLQEENAELKKQLKYLRSGEYYNQLKFERDMLQHIVDNSEISKEDKEFIDCTHRNTELLEENESLKNNYDRIYNENCKLREKHNINDISLLDENEELTNQQKEFVNWLNETLEELECDDADDEELKDYLLQRIDTFKEILSKYKEIIARGNRFRRVMRNERLE